MISEAAGQTTQEAVAMITENQISEIGRFNQPHGIKGELNAVVFDGAELEDLSCLILDIDGIFVPFFISGLRRRGTQSFLVSIDGIENEQQAAAIANKTIYALSDEIKEYENDFDEDGFYAEDLIGFKISTADGALSGKITDIDDATENVLLIVTADDGRTHLIPFADEIIADIEADTRHVTVELPEGLLEL